MGLHEHFRFLRIPTLSTTSASVELIFAIESVRAQYCLEPSNRVQIFHAAVVVAMFQSGRLQEYGMFRND